MSTTLEHRIQQWLDGSFDAETQAEIRRLQKHDPIALADAFFKDLSFGTGGLRGIMGIGTNRMNIYTIRRVTQGLANYLNRRKGQHKVFIGYDVRHNSRLFAVETARVLAGNGIRALLSREICPTPLASFACRHYQCSAAVMITASHNPPQYNGYKVYGSDGGQIVPPEDGAILAEIEQVRSPALLGDAFEEIGPEIDLLYLAELKKLQLAPELSQVPLKILYTNLHGTGIRLIPRALQAWGYTHLSFVEKQLPLDGDFSFAPSPNPEDEKALVLGTEQLRQEKGDLLIATDPDADRVGVVAAGVRLTGNQIGCLCLHHICKTLTEQGRFPPRAAFIKTIVTTELFRRIAESFGGQCIDVLTGFKYIGEQITRWEKEAMSPQYIFGAEESYGYLFGTFVRDKDAISAACLIAEVAAAAKKEGLSLLDRLHQIYQNYGLHREALFTLAFPDSQVGMEQIGALMQRLRKNPPTHIDGQAVVSCEDYLRGSKGLPASDVLRFWLADGSKLVIRPSGTEPKVKIYAEVKQKMEGEASIQSCDLQLKALSQNFFK